MSAHTDDVVLQDIRKSFGPNEVLKGIDLTFRGGAVHALLGANGAGKSTLLGCLSGATRPDDGSITIGGRAYSGFTPLTALQAGTAIIYQHFQVIGDLTVADNVFLGDEIRSAGGRIDVAAQCRVTKDILTSLGSPTDPRQLVGTLSVGEQQIVEIARAIRHDPKLLILDEPTAALSRHEAAALGALVRRLAATTGIAVIYVTHLLHEVLAVADEVSVLRDGRLMWTKPVDDVSIESLVEAVSPQSAPTAAAARESFGDPLLQLQDLYCQFTGPIDLAVRGGEILGLFGLLGSGRTNLLETITGVERPRAGGMRLSSQRFSPRGPGSALRAGVALVPADRKAQALYGPMTAEDNVVIPVMAQIARCGVRNRKRERALFTTIAEQLTLSPRSPRLEADRFSGGNAQKLVVGRWLNAAAGVRVLVLDEPTQGIDAGARTELYRQLRDFVSTGDRCVVFASSDPEEIGVLADRVLVLAEGRAVGELGPHTAERDLLRLAHAGEKAAKLEEER